MQTTSQPRDIVGQPEQQGLPQGAMVPQPDLGFPERPVLVAHQAQDRQQLRLREDRLGDLTPVRQHPRLRHGAADQSDPHQAHVGHVESPRPPPRASQGWKQDQRRMSTEPNRPKLSLSLWWLGLLWQRSPTAPLE